ncbi:MAG: hypothetical protein VCB25_07665, partial [Myxococcota bacterium]
RLFRTTSIIYAALIFAMFSTSWYWHVEAQREAAHLVSRVRQEIRAREMGSSGEPILLGVLGIPNSIRGVPVYGRFLGEAFRAPFTDDELLVHSIADANTFTKGVQLYFTNPSVQMLEWKTEETRDLGRFVELSHVLPGPIAHHPIIENPVEDTPHLFDPPLRPRDVRCLALEFSEAPTRPFSLTLRFHDERGAKFELPLEWNPALGTAKRIYLSLEHAERSREWLFLGFIRRLEIAWETETGPPPRLTAIHTGETLPTIVVAAPTAGSKISIDASEPIWFVTDESKSTYLRFTLYAGELAVHWTKPRLELITDGDRIGFQTSMKTRFPGEFPFPWERLSGDNGASPLSLSGVGETPIRFRIAGFRGQLVYPQAITAMTEVFLIR